MSRTLRTSGVDDPHAGTAHWPVTSALVIGAGVRGGQVFGAVDLDGGSLAIDLATGAPASDGHVLLYSHFVAGLLSLCGVDPAPHLVDIPVFEAFAV